MKQLIVTADDFGLSGGVNRAVEQGWRDGLLTGASIMPGGAAFDEAVDIAGRNPGLQIGLHLTLVQGHGVLPHAEIPGLVDAAGRFDDNPVKAGLRYFLDRGLYCQLKREIEAQIVRVRDAGIALTHIDGHLNIHLHPTVFRILAELMPRYGIFTFRLARERLAENLRFDRERRFGKTVESFIFGRLTDHARPELDRLGIIDGIEEGLTEIYFHPGILPDAVITSLMPDYRHQEELAAITSPLVRQRLRELRIQVRNYRGEVKC